MQARVLVVDDDPIACQFIKETLVHTTCMEILAFSDSKAASACLNQEKFAVALFDLRMPSPDGPELARLTRSSGLNQMTPIIMISDDQSTAAIAEGFEAGAHFFLYKPIDKSRLLRLIRAMQGAVEHERRRFRRIPFQTRVRLQFEKADVDGETIDVSLNGLLVKVPEGTPAEIPVRVSLFAPGESMPITGSGAIVRRLGHNRLGIHLNRLAPTESSRLEELLLPMILQEEKSAPEPALAQR